VPFFKPFGSLFSPPAKPRTVAGGMTLEPALAALDGMDPAWKDAYDDALPAAAAFVAKLPLVRVVVPHVEPRKGTETDDTLRYGRILPRHKSLASAESERKLGAADGIYFHGGRTHPAYGKVALVLYPLDQEAQAEVTPFGLGGLLCKGSGEHHDARHCVAPVAHLSEPEQAAYVAASTWRSGWRAPDQAARFIAAYFGADLGAYFSAEDAGRPTRLDPAGVFHPTTGCRDWRAWTFEVRIAAEIDLFRVLDSGRVMMWAMDDELFAELIQRQPAPLEPSWWLAKLMQTEVRRIAWPEASFEDLLMTVDREVKKACLA
jgi:hypothetical protein